MGERSLYELMNSEKQKEFAKNKKKRLPLQCLECEFLFACHGECPKNRFIKDRYGNPGKNYLCEGYRQYFRHVAPYMDFMKSQLQHQQPPAAIMQAIREGTRKF